MCKEKGQCHGDCGNCKTPLPRQLQKLQDAFEKRKGLEYVKNLPQISLPSLEEDITNNLIQKVVVAWEKQLIAALIPKLVLLGVDAREENMPEWAKRLTKVQDMEHQEVFDWFLDYKPELSFEQQTFLLRTCEKQTITYDGAKTTVTIG